MPQCTAKAKRTGHRCTRPAMIGTTVCLQHGGRAALQNRGIGSPRFRHGRKSKYLPTALAARAAAAMDDPDLLDLRENIAILDARISEALQHLNDEAAPGDWAAARKAMMRLRAARRSRDEKAVTAAEARLETILDQGAAGGRIWSEIRGMLQEQRKMIESERRRLVEMQQVITAEEAVGMVTAIAMSIREHVTDQNALQAIQRDIERFMTSATNRRIDV